MAAGLGEGSRPEFHLGGEDSRLLGEDGFAEQVLAPAAGRPGAAPAPEAIVGRVCAAYGLQASELAGPSRARRLAEARGVIGHLASGIGAAGLSELAARFRRDPSNLSRAASRVERRLAEDPDFAKRIETLNNAITHA